MYSVQREHHHVFQMWGPHATGGIMIHMLPGVSSLVFALFLGPVKVDEDKGDVASSVARKRSRTLGEPDFCR